MENEGFVAVCCQMFGDEGIHWCVNSVSYSLHMNDLIETIYTAARRLLYYYKMCRMWEAEERRASPAVPAARDSKGLYSHGCLKKSSESPERTRHPACMFLSRLCSSVPLKLNSAPGMPLLSVWLTAPGQTAAPGLTADDGSAGDDAFVWDSAFCDGTCLLCFLSWHTSVW